MEGKRKKWIKANLEMTTKHNNICNLKANSDNPSEFLPQSRSS